MRLGFSTVISPLGGNTVTVDGMRMGCSTVISPLGGNTVIADGMMSTQGS